MTNYFKLKKYWILSIGMMLYTMVTGAQEFSDQEIGFDVARETIMLKEHGVADQDLDWEIAMLREQYGRMYQEMKKHENEILQKTQSEQKGQTTANSALDASIIPDTERAALKALYDATDGAHWKNTTGLWQVNDPNSDVSTWFGVTVRGGHVVILNLNYNNLTGSIPSEIGNLSLLKQLILSENNISGEIPTEIGLLTQLTTLWLYNNNLNGSIPLEIGNLSLLQQLRLDDNNISGEIPTEIGLLTQLTNLSLIRNNLNGSIPSEIGNLSLLQTLILSDNNISGEIPTEIGLLTQLTFLWLSHNNLNGSIPSEIGNLSLLQQLILSENNLSGEIPTEIGLLTQLTTLWLYNNKLSGVIPDLSALPSLKQFLIYGNKFRFLDFANEFLAYKTKMPGTNNAVFYYSPQAKINIPEIITKSFGQSVDLKMFADGDTRYLENDKYRWFKGGVVIDGAIGRVYTIPSLGATHAGVYTCVSYHILNPDMSPLILEREPITLRVVNCTLATGTIKTAPVSPVANANVNFSLETASTGLTYSWIFYELDNVTPKSTATTAITTQQYSAPGVYKVRLVITAANNCVTPFDTSITVGSSICTTPIIGKIKITNAP